MQEKILSLLQSRRFWAAAIGMALPLLNDKLGLNLTPEQIQHITYLLMTWIVGDSLAKTSLLGGGNATPKA